MDEDDSMHRLEGSDPAAQVGGLIVKKKSAAAEPHVFERRPHARLCWAWMCLQPRRGRNVRIKSKGMLVMITERNQKFPPTKTGRKAKVILGQMMKMMKRTVTPRRRAGSIVRPALRRPPAPEGSVKSSVDDTNRERKTDVSTESMRPPKRTKAKTERGAERRAEIVGVKEMSEKAAPVVAAVAHSAARGVSAHREMDQSASAGAVGEMNPSLHSIAREMLLRPLAPTGRRMTVVTQVHANPNPSGSLHPPPPLKENRTAQCEAIPLVVRVRGGTG
ncbi:unnamed protein product, partial [Lampetra planeri]